ncbi:hypothetical protein KCU77_g4052, partial [Aureobasidium melanogenum]
MYTIPIQRQVRARRSRHPSKYRSKRRPGRFEDSSDSHVPSLSLDLSDGQWSQLRTAAQEFQGRQSAQSWSISANAPFEQEADDLEISRILAATSMSLGFDGSRDEDISPMSEHALDCRARMLVNATPGTQLANLLPRGRTCIIIAQYPGTNQVRVRGLKSGNPFVIDMPATNLRVLPENRENTVGYPCEIVNRSWTVPSTDRNPENRTLHFEVGENGIITDVDAALWLARVVIPSRKDYTGVVVNGFIELDNVRVGSRKYGHLGVRFRNRAPAITITNIGPQTSSPYPLTKYYFDLYTALLQNSSPLGLPDSFSIDMNDPQGRYTLCHELADGVNRAGLTAIFGGPTFNNFTFRQIRDRARPVTTDLNTTGGVYGRRLTEFSEKSARAFDDVLAYVGKASLFGRRKHGYNSDPWDTKNPSYNGRHFTAIREAGKREMFILMDIPVNHRNFQNMIVYGEQAMLCLLQTYRGDVLSSGQALPQAANATTAVGAVSYFAAAKTDSAVIHNIATQVGAQHSMPGGVLRPGFGATDGLNYSSPLLETKANEKTPIVKLDLPDREIFLRPPIKMNALGQVWWLNHTRADGRTIDTFQVGLSNEERRRIPKDVNIYPAWEMMKNGIAHTVPYFRLPEITTWTGAEEIKTLACKIVWRGADSWKQMYLQVKRNAHVADGTVRGTAGNYDDGFSMLHYLKREVVHPPHPWMHRNQTARILVPELDHLSQTISIDYDLRPLRQVPTSTLKSTATVATEMTNAGLRNVGAARGTAFTGGRRKRCDNCFNRDKAFQRVNLTADMIKRINQHDVCEFTLDPQGNICNDCWNTGLVCSYTTKDELVRRKDAYFGVLHMEPANLEATQVYDINDPGFDRFQIDE